jgi:hypothetical protein
MKQIERAELHHIDHRVDISGRCEENCRHILASSAERTDEAGPVQVRHPHVDEQTLWSVRAEVVEKCARARERANAASSRYQQTPDSRSDSRIVIDDRYERGFITHAPATG